MFTLPIVCYIPDDTLLRTVLYKIKGIVALQYSGLKTMGWPSWGIQREGEVVNSQRKGKHELGAARRGSSQQTPAGVEGTSHQKKGGESGTAKRGGGQQT